MLKKTTLFLHGGFPYLGFKIIFFIWVFDKDNNRLGKSLWSNIEIRERFQKNGNLKWHLPLSFGPLLYNVYMQWGKGMDGKIVPLRGLEAGARGVRSLIANAIITIHFSC